MSEIKSNKISPRKGTTTTIGDSGDSVTISSGTTTTNAGTISTAGITGGTINNTTGTIEGLQQQVSWQTGSIKTASFTASANEGYFLNTTSGQITVTLPASPSAGDVVAVKDYADTFDTNKAILNANGNKIQGSTTNFEITVEGTAAILLYIDSTKGWLLVDQSKAADITEDIKFVTATGGTVATCGNFKIHSFTGPGTFCVSCGGNSAGSNSVDYLVVAGGGGGGAGPNYSYAGGGGAGGFRINTSLPVSAQAYPIAVGGGGPAGTNGSNSTFSSITSTAGGAGGNGGGPVGDAGSPGGSGGGGGSSSTAPETGPTANPGGTGNTPPVSPPQGNNGGFGQHQPGVSGQQGGGGGASQTGRNGDIPHTPTSGDGGNGSPATPVFGASPKPFYGPTNGVYAGGGGGMGDNAGTGGSGGGGNAAVGGGAAGTTNTGGGGANGATGGSGIVLIRYKFQN